MSIQLSQGFSLLEVLISLMLLSLLLLGFDVLQLHAMRTIKLSHQIMLAAQQIYNLQEKLQIAPQDSVTDIVAQWNIENSQLLPNGQGKISGSYSNYTVEIRWGATDLQNCVLNQLKQSGCLREVGHA